MNLDKYARDGRSWRDWAKINHVASKLLFGSGNPFLYFPAATLGHHALEMYLKAILIGEGMIVFNPAQVNKLDPLIAVKKVDCVWGHNLAALAKLLATRRSDFDLSTLIDVPCLVLEMPMKLLAAFELYDPFFSELRYPMELKQLDGVSEEESRVLDAIIEYLQPFLNKVI